MKTLEEVQEYFKDAEVVESFGGVHTGTINTKNLRYGSSSKKVIVCESDNKAGITTLYHPEFGYAKIIKYKNKVNMKKVILENRPKEVETAYLDDINDDSIVGLIDIDGNKRQLIQVKTGDYTSLNNNSSLTSSSQYSDQKALVLNLMKYVIKEVFIFDSHKELYKWLAED